MSELSSSWGSYPSIFQLGHKAVQDLLKSDVNVEEKLDGSQFSFGLVEASPADIEAEYQPGYALKIRSKGCVMHIDAPEKMFNLAAETVRSLAGKLHLGWTYRGEFLAKPKHNSLAYDRVPVGHVIIFDVNTGNQEFLSYEDKKAEAERLGLECVPLLFRGRIGDAESVRKFFDTASVLGGQRIEGVVVKPVNYDLYGADKKVLMGKLVSEIFKEVHRKAWGESNPSNTDIIKRITAELTTAARWHKAAQHLRESGRLNEDVTDIGPLIKEVLEDVTKECEDEIKDKLFAYAWPHIRRGLTHGLPEWWKDQLLRKSFESAPEQGSTGEAKNVESNPFISSDLVNE